MHDNGLRDSDGENTECGRDNGGGDRRLGEELPKQTTPWHTLSARVICLVSRKGGVGKTTTAVNLGAAFALSGHTVLVVSVDPQCGVCRSLGHDPSDLDGCLTDVLLGDRSLVHSAHTSSLKNLFFVSPGIRSLEEEETFLQMMRDEADTFVAEIDRARNLYDTVLIDCPPGLGTTTRTALSAADSYLVPVQAEELCRESLAPLLEFVETYRTSIDIEEDRARTSFGPESRSLELEGLFLTMASKHTRMGRHVAERVQTDHGERLLVTAVPRTIRLTEMALRGKPAVIYDRRSPGSRAYFNLADELLDRYERRAGAEVPQPVYSDLEPVEILPRESRTSEVEASLGGDAAESDPLSPPESARTTGSLDRFLSDVLPDTDSAEVSVLGEDFSGPEIVSLDELLAEEERATGPTKDWDEDPWNGDSESDGRSN